MMERYTSKSQSMMQSTDMQDLFFIYPFYKNMHNNNVMFCFLGVVNPDVVLHMLEIMEDALEEESYSRRLTKKIGNVMVECLTNLYSSGEEQIEGKDGYDPRSIFIVRKLSSNSFLIASGQYIPNNKVRMVKKLMEKISSFSIKEIKEEYKRILSEADFNDENLIALSILDLARKSGGDLIHSLEYLNTKFSFFTLEAKLSR